MGQLFGRGGCLAARSAGEGPDLDQVVGEYPVPAPDRRSLCGVQAGAVPAVAVFEVADPAFAPVRHLTSRRKPRPCSTVLRAREVVAWRGIAIVGTPAAGGARSA